MINSKLKDFIVLVHVEQIIGVGYSYVVLDIQRFSRVVEMVNITVIYFWNIWMVGSSYVVDWIIGMNVLYWNILPLKKLACHILFLLFIFLLTISMFSILVCEELHILSSYIKFRDIYPVGVGDSDFNPGKPLYS